MNQHQISQAFYEIYDKTMKPETDWPSFKLGYSTGYEDARNVAPAVPAGYRLQPISEFDAMCKVVHESGLSPSAGLRALHIELGQMRWLGEDDGWDRAIDAVRKRIEEMMGGCKKSGALKIFSQNGL